MLSVLLVPLMLSGVAAAGVPAPARATTADPVPAVRVSLDRNVYQRGDQAHVQVDIRDDGYLVVMRVSPDGLVRVLFPLDPSDDNFVRGGKSYEIVGRGGGNAFDVESDAGSGMVYAAWSAQQFQFNDFARDGHWDYTVIGDSAMAQDPETGLSNLVGRMATAHFDYDLQTYSTQQIVASAGPNYYIYPSPYYDSFYDPFYDPFYYGYGPFYGGAFFTIGFGGGPFFYRPFYRPFPTPIFFRRPFFARPFVTCFDCGVFARTRPFTPFRFKGGIVGGATVVGIQYRPRTTFASNAFVGRSRGRFGGMSIGMNTIRRGPSLRPADVSGRHVPSMRVPNAEARMDGPTVFGPGRRVPFSGSRAIPDRPHFTPTMRAPESFRGVSRPGTRVAEPPTRVSQPRGRPGFQSAPRFNGPAERVAAPRVEAPRVESPRAESPRIESPRVQSPRMESPRMTPQRSQRPEMRMETPRYEGSRAAPRVMQAPREAPRMSAPRMSAPRMSAPRMSAPRMSAPRMSAPRMSAPRGGGGGGGGHHHR